MIEFQMLVKLQANNKQTITISLQNEIICSLLTKSRTRDLPNWLKRLRTVVPVTGRVGEAGGWRACLSPAPMLNRTFENAEKSLIKKNESH